MIYSLFLVLGSYLLMIFPSANASYRLFIEDKLKRFVVVTNYGQTEPRTTALLRSVVTSPLRHSVCTSLRHHSSLLKVESGKEARSKELQSKSWRASLVWCQVGKSFFKS